MIDINILRELSDDDLQALVRKCEGKLNTLSGYVTDEYLGLMAITINMHYALKDKVAKLPEMIEIPSFDNKITMFCLEVAYMYFLKEKCERELFRRSQEC